MELSRTVEGLQEDLTRLAGLGDEAVAEAASRLAGAMSGPATLRLLELLGQAASEIGLQIPSGRVELRISGKDAELVFVEEEEDSGSRTETPLDEQSARISLRLPEQLKVRIEQAAAREGVSTNTWIVRTLSRSPSAERSKSSHKRLSGYGRA